MRNMYLVNAYLAVFLKVTVNQYDNPIKCYSEDTLEEMTTSSTWMKTDDQVSSKNTIK